MRRIHWVLALISAVLPAQSMLPGDLVSSLASVGEGGVELVASPGPGFSEAFRIATPQAGRAMSDATLYWTNAAPVHGGDRLTLTFWARKVAPDDLYNLRATVGLEFDAGEPLLDTVFPCNLSTWTKYSFPVSSPRGYDAGELRLVFRHGLGPQIYEIGGLQLINRAGPPAPPAPVCSFIPAGSAPTAPVVFVAAAS